MKKVFQFAGAGFLCLGMLGVSRAAAQDPVLTPIIVNTAAPIIINAIKPKPKQDGLVRFVGYVMHANRAEITVRAAGDDMSIQTFALSATAAEKMQKIVDQGGYQYGDKIKLEYDPGSKQVIKFKGKPSKPL
ncbi:MAG TPA: hypothetical protein VL128_15640 [Candidatus Eisenbacteria bacterium]|nr:hypothetical protein [Candidatus Eisenbacteria bacterium]